MIIPAEVHSDDYVYTVNFDAVEWFEQAQDSEIISLAEIGWRGDYAADAVAKFFAESNPDVATLMDYLRRISGLPSHEDYSGFECSVTEDAVLDWLKINRPALHRVIHGR